MYTTRKQRINGFACGFYDFRPQIKSREKNDPDRTQGRERVII